MCKTTERGTLTARPLLTNSASRESNVSQSSYLISVKPSVRDANRDCIYLLYWRRTQHKLAVSSAIRTFGRPGGVLSEFPFIRPVSEEPPHRNGRAAAALP